MKRPATGYVTKIPQAVTHSGLEWHQTPSMMVNWIEGPWELYKPRNVTTHNDSRLEFKFSGAKNETHGTVLDLSNIFLQLKVDFGTSSQADAVAGENRPREESPGHINCLLHSLFEDVEIRVNDVRVSSSNKLYPFKSYFETELLSTNSMKMGILECEGYQRHHYLHRPNHLLDS